VYWNSRLQTEHERLVQLFNPEDIVVDAFAGVGPFAIPAARRGCAVIANDLNPESAKYLDINVRDNRVNDVVRVSCEDGRNIIRSAARSIMETPLPAYTGPKLSRVQERAQKKSSQRAPSATAPRKRISHFVMNLPDSAITFLDAFRGILSSEITPGASEVYDIMPMVHCHCFTREIEPEKAVIDIRQASKSFLGLEVCLSISQRVEEQLGGPLTDEFSLHLVRSVAPNKDMYCVSFRLPRDVAYMTST
jgi:tRNA (guanine37-N1)-methyltransferase